MIFSFNAKPDTYVTTKIRTKSELQCDYMTMGHHYLFCSTFIIISACAGGLVGHGDEAVLQVDLDLLNVSGSLKYIEIHLTV